MFFCNENWLGLAACLVQYTMSKMNTKAFLIQQNICSSEQNYYIFQVE